MANQSECFTAIKSWVENEAPFKGKTDEDFLLMFLRSCDFDLEQTRKTLVLYYQNRVKYPKWWANRNLNEPFVYTLLNQKATTLLIDKYYEQPTILISFLACYGIDSNIDNWAKFSSVIFEVLARRVNCQLNGCVAINDCRNYPWWIPAKCMWPPFIKEFIYSFNYAMPIKVKKIIFVNAPSFASVIFRLAFPLLNDTLKQKIFFCSNWSDVSKHVSMKYLPDEYDGQSGPLQQHQDAFHDEYLSFNNYLINDNKYGYLDN